MRIVILRHGEATLSNCDRVLSSQGMKEAVATGQKLSKILTITKNKDRTDSQHSLSAIRF